MDHIINFVRQQQGREPLAPLPKTPARRGDEEGARPRSKSRLTDVQKETARLKKVIGDSSDLPPSEYFSSQYQGVDLADDLPPEGSWVLPTIYTETSGGQIKAWRIGYNSDLEALIWVYGTHSGDATQVFFTKIVTNTLRKTLQDKAWQDARRKMTDKMMTGYSLDLQNLSKVSSGDLGFPLPMLANLYRPPGLNPKTGKVVSSNVREFPVALQAKFDGVRSMVRIDPRGSGTVQLVSRELRERHFFSRMRGELGTFLREYLPEGTILDGELFIVGEECQDINGITSAKKEPHPQEELVRMYVFDIYHPTKKWTTEERVEMLNKAFESYVEDGHPNDQFLIVKTVYADSHEEVTEICHSYLKQGYEGAMIRHLAHGETEGRQHDLSLYSHTRTNALLKMKTFLDAEVTIFGVKPGKGKDADLALFLYEDPFNGTRGVVRPAATHADRREWLRDPDSVIGLTYVVKYQNRTPDGKMRFPTGSGFRDRKTE